MDFLFEPQLTASTQAFIRVAYGMLLILTLLQTLPLARWFFVSETHGGYLDPGPVRDALFRPATMYLLMPVWIASAVCLVVDVATPLAGLTNLVLGWLLLFSGRQQPPQLPPGHAPPPPMPPQTPAGPPALR